MINENCECCGKSISDEAVGSQKFCKSCRLYICKLRDEIAHLKTKVKTRDTRISKLEFRILSMGGNLK